MTYGAKESKVDFLHVDNLVQAHALAAEGLTAKKDKVAVSCDLWTSDYNKC